MDEETKETISELIQILLTSNTSKHSDGVISHGHDMFDEQDVSELEKLQREL